jgi:micrococcal nuclease
MRGRSWAKVLPCSIGAVIVALVLSCYPLARASADSYSFSATPAPSLLTIGRSSLLKPKGETVAGVQVRRVVDGDTIIVGLGEGDVTVRMIGINSPESVKPDWPVECYGPESSAFAQSALAGRTVTLEFDQSQGRRDQYGRTLAYVWIERAAGALRMFNLDAVARGYARERQYGPVRYAWRNAFREAQATARRAGIGLWGACT